MIEYKLISNILNRICEMTKKPLEYPKNDTNLDPFRHLLKIKTWGTKWKRVIDKIDEWADGDGLMQRQTKKILN